MHIPAGGAFPEGYTAITGADGQAGGTRLEFGILRLSAGGLFTGSRGAGLEQAFLHIAGSAALKWEGGGVRVARGSMLEEPPAVLHLPPGTAPRVEATAEGCEFAVFGVANDKAFQPRLIAPQEVAVSRLGSAALGHTADRLLRTAIDDESAPYANMTVGELINFPGCWSSYPPHHHPHPEIYHYRFFPEQGFGFSAEGQAVYTVRQGDTVALSPHQVHPQAAAPGYTMLYIWAMPHLPGNRFGAGSRVFVPEHAWLLS